MSEPLLVLGVIAVVGAVVGLEIYVLAKVARRILGQVRRLRDSGQIGGALTEETRAALRRHGIDPAALDLAALRSSPELEAQVRDSLREALQGALRERGAVGLLASGIGLARRGAEPPTPTAGAPTPRARSRPAPPPAPAAKVGIGRPAAIEAPGGPGWRSPVAVAIVAGVAATLLARLLGWA